MTWRLRDRLRWRWTGRRRLHEYERFVQLSPTMVTLAGHDGYWKRASPAVLTILGYSQAEALARPYLEFVHPDDREQVRHARQRAAETTPSFTFECRMRHKDGSFRLIEWTITPFPDRKEMYGIGRDVTDRRRAEREQAAIQRIATLVAQEPPRSALFDVIAEEAGSLLDAAEARLSRFTDDQSATVVGHSGSSSSPLGEELLATMARSGRPVTSADATTLAIPVFAEGGLWGSLAVAAAPGQALPPYAETSLKQFTSLMATAIADAESRHALARLAEEQAALHRVAMLVAHDAAPGEVFAAVAGEAGTLLGSDISMVACCNGDGTVLVLGSWSTYADGLPVGTRVTLGGHNAMSIVARTGRPARLSNYDDATGDPAEIAKREGWKSAIAAPILVERRIWGLLLIATRRNESFAADTEQRLATFTDLAATAVANTQAHEQVRRYGEEQASLRRIATLVAKGTDPEALLNAITDELAGTFAAMSAVMRFEHDLSEVVLVGKSSEIAVPTGSRWPIKETPAAAAVQRTRQSVRVEAADLVPTAGPNRAEIHRPGIVSTVASPIIVEGRLWGVMTVSDRDQLPPDTEQRLTRFADLFTTAIANSESRSELAASRRRIVAAADEARRTIERNLHDGAQQRLVSLALAVRSVQSSLPASLGDLRDDLSTVAAGLAAAVDELRELARGIHPAALAQGGLSAALRALARRSAIAVDLKLALNERPAEPIEAAVYFVVSEALANAVKHSAATLIEVWVEHRDETLHLAIRDDGAGGADPRGWGLLGLRDRVEALGGSLSVDSPLSQGTRITADLPFRLDPLRPSA
ncbi:GAF domain-containing protein [Paractinoplanes deccanensis]|uniref:GAF domain-containing protein n=1 Tax=Paractinoplanes deccanensis TaxID=113561 RepID=UPI0023B35555|nr:GAF domain-containing protein [Actinoplanes deccanensis]